MFFAKVAQLKAKHLTISLKRMNRHISSHRIYSVVVASRSRSGSYAILTCYYNKYDRNASLLLLHPLFGMKWLIFKKKLSSVNRKEPIKFERYLPQSGYTSFSAKKCWWEQTQRVLILVSAAMRWLLCELVRGRERHENANVLMCCGIL